MRPFALTYPQLMNQALAQGMEDHQVSQLRSAHELAEAWFDGFYRGQGTPFLCHLVRTASIVLTEGQPIEAVIASLLHAIYMMGLFENGHRIKTTSRQREKVREAIGPEAEGLIWDYDQLPWHCREALNRHLEHFETYGEKTRRLLVMRLANELEDFLDLGMVYRGTNPFREKIEAYGGQCLELARRLELSQLAKELHEAFEAHLSCQLPKVVLRNHRDAYKLPQRLWLEMGLIERSKVRVKKILRTTLQGVSGDSDV